MKPKTPGTSEKKWKPPEKPLFWQKMFKTFGQKC